MKSHKIVWGIVLLVCVEALGTSVGIAIDI